MKRFLLYSFLNFPFADLIQHPIEFSFHKLKDDLIEFKSLIKIQKPDLIIGIAKSPNLKSRFETKAVNIFNKIKTIDKKGIEQYELSFPIDGYRDIALNKKYTDSFCNWTMYKIAQYLEGSNTKLQFIHISENDLKYLNIYLDSL